MDITLYFAPDSCARVPLVALEETGQPYKIQVVAFMKGQHRSAEYLQINPKGKVPTLCVNGAALTENVAILGWLADQFPDAQLLPQPTDTWDRARYISDLAYCASGLHPLVTRLRIPQFFCDTPLGSDRVFEMAEIAMRPHFEFLDSRLATRRWWYGEQWSIMDAYLNWVWFRVVGTRFDASAYTNFARHDRQMQERPAMIRASRVNTEVADSLAAQGLAVKFSGIGAVSAPPRS
jgi:glutathione S-transferase